MIDNPDKLVQELIDRCTSWQKESQEEWSRVEELGSKLEKEANKLLQFKIPPLIKR